jgi:predicted Zn-dependent peptidase
VICVVGALKPEKVAAMVGKYYGAIPSQARPAALPAAEPAQEEERVSVLSLGVQVEKAYFGYRIPDARHEDQVPLYVLSYILSSGRSSRLYRALVDSGMCIDQGASLNGAKDPSLFYVSFTCQSGKKAGDALGAMDRVLAELTDVGVTEEELSRVKNKLRTEIHLGLVTNQARCRFIGQHEIVLGDVRAGLAEIDHIQRVSAEDIQRVAARYLKKQNRSVVIGKPE